jgi:hypothetical protein
MLKKVFFRFLFAFFAFLPLFEFNRQNKLLHKLTGGRLTEIQLIEIVFYHLIEIMLIT